MLTSIFKHNFNKKTKEVCIKTRSTSASHSHEASGAKPTTGKWCIGKCKMGNLVTFKIHFREVQCGLFGFVAHFSGGKGVNLS